MRLTFLKLRKSRASLEHVVLKYFNYYAIDYLERKRIKGTLFISFACFWKASPKQKTAEARKIRYCLLRLRLTCHASVFATCVIIALAAQAQAFSPKKTLLQINGPPASARTAL